MIARRIFLSNLTMFVLAAPALAAPKPARDPAAIVAEIYSPTREETYGGSTLRVLLKLKADRDFRSKSSNLCSSP